MNARGLAFASLFVVAACGSGNSGIAPRDGAPLSNLTSASLTITVPRGPSSAQRTPRFVSPNSASILITVLTVNGAAPTAAQVPPAVNPTSVALSTAGGGNCTVTTAGETCTVPLPVPTGSVQYLLQVKDAASHVLSRNTVTFTVLPGVANQTFTAVLDGVVASVTVQVPAVHAGTAFSGPITVNAFDASGAGIAGAAPYANTFTLTDSDTTGHTSLTVNGVTATTVTVTSPNDVVLLNYDGAPDPPFTVTATIQPG